MNPTSDVFEQRLAALDGGVGRWQRLPASLRSCSP